MANRLIQETSPYLLQHAANPIDWWPWCDEAFAEAKRRDVPIFLSIGYSSCHWCHVMAHESFEDLQVAEALNRAFVSIKLDREERPDLDFQYMLATQLSTGRGGWPMTLFLNHDRVPFFAGTYFPKQDIGKRPGFLSLCLSVEEAWDGARVRLEEAASEFKSSMVQASSRHRSATALLDQAFVEKASNELLDELDREHGGYRGSPKFPPHSVISWLLASGNAPDFAQLTLDHMCLGGIHDHVGGGFHRYSTDEKWRLPHFEKMLTDNALLLRNLARSFDENHQRAAKRIISWVEREMTAPDGTFFTAIDADSGGGEGLFYTWLTSELEPEVARAFNVNERGNFADEATGEQNGQNVLYTSSFSHIPDDTILENLLQQRDSRPKPLVDHKAIASANGMMIEALVTAGRADLAKGAIDTWASEFRRFGYLPHEITSGFAKGIGFLDDYAFMLRAAVALHDDDFSTELAKQLIEQFFDRSYARFSYVSEKHELVLVADTRMLDNATPSPVPAGILALEMLDRSDEAKRVFHHYLGWMELSVESTGSFFELANEMPQLTQIVHFEVNSEGEFWIIRPIACSGFTFDSFEVHAQGEVYHLGSNTTLKVPKTALPLKARYRLCDAFTCFDWQESDIEHAGARVK